MGFFWGGRRGDGVVGGCLFLVFFFFKQAVLKSKLMFWSQYQVLNICKQPSLISDPFSSQFLNRSKTYTCKRAPGQSKTDESEGILSVPLTKTCFHDVSGKELISQGFMVSTIILFKMYFKFLILFSVSDNLVHSAIASASGHGRSG